MFSMCECRPGCSSRCLLQIAWPAFQPSGGKKKKRTHDAALGPKVALPNSSLHNKQLLQPQIHSLITRIHGKKGDGGGGGNGVGVGGGVDCVTRCQYRFDICVRACKRVCVCSMTHSRNLTDRIPAIAWQRERNAFTPKDTHNHTTWSTQSTEIPLKKKKILIETHVSH